MNRILPAHPPDIQAGSDGRGLAIRTVGVKSVRHPLKLRTRNGAQQTVAAARIGDLRLAGFALVSENFGPIHKPSAYARLEGRVRA